MLSFQDHHVGYCINVVGRDCIAFLAYCAGQGLEAWAEGKRIHSGVSRQRKVSKDQTTIQLTARGSLIRKIKRGKVVADDRGVSVVWSWDSYGEFVSEGGGSRAGDEKHMVNSPCHDDCRAWAVKRSTRKIWCPAKRRIYGEIYAVAMDGSRISPGFT